MVFGIREGFRDVITQNMLKEFRKRQERERNHPDRLRAELSLQANQTRLMAMGWENEREMRMSDRRSFRRQSQRMSERAERQDRRYHQDLQWAYEQERIQREQYESALAVGYGAGGDRRGGGRSHGHGGGGRYGQWVFLFPILPPLIFQPGAC